MSWKEAKARFWRWCHCMWWIFRPWRFREEMHCCIDIVGPFPEECYGNPANQAKLLGCTCGKVFYKNGPESQYQFDEWMRRLKTRQGKRWRS